MNKKSSFQWTWQILLELVLALSIIVLLSYAAWRIFISGNAGISLFA